MWLLRRRLLQVTRLRYEDHFIDSVRNNDKSVTHAAFGDLSYRFVTERGRGISDATASVDNGQDLALDEGGNDAGPLQRNKPRPPSPSRTVRPPDWDNPKRTAPVALGCH